MKLKSIDITDELFGITLRYDGYDGNEHRYKIEETTFHIFYFDAKKYVLDISIEVGRKSYDEEDTNSFTEQYRDIISHEFTLFHECEEVEDVEIDFDEKKVLSNFNLSN